MMPRFLFAALGIVVAASGVAGQGAADARLGKPKDLNSYFPFTPPATREAWEVRKKVVQQQLRVALGLWPEPAKTPLNPVIRGKIVRDGYTIENVYFSSMPGHYVTGNLYRPTNDNGGKKRPAVLSPHGHWANGRLYEANDKEVARQLKAGAEKTEAGARYPLQARCAQLARMGCIVFHYDMVGYADNTAIAHRAGFTDVEAELRLQSFMGLQTWNSIRALDFLAGLSDVDPNRIGVTGASGGGTQTFILCGLDSRPAAAFPAVMVSTAMQGGCICENCSYLRVDTGNIEFAALFAPKPLGMSAANDWTKDIETKGLPELRKLYATLGAEDRLLCKAFLQFDHNYNQVSREVMYDFFNGHLRLGQTSPVKEAPFDPVLPKDLKVFTPDHSAPKDFLDSFGLRRTMTEWQSKQVAELPHGDVTKPGTFESVMLGALESMVVDRLPSSDEIKVVEKSEPNREQDFQWAEIVLTRNGENQRVRCVGAMPTDFGGQAVVLVYPNGIEGVRKEKEWAPEFSKAIKAGAAVLAVETLRTGASAGHKATPVNKSYAGYTFGYNRPLAAERVRDILTAVRFAKDYKGVKTVHLVGMNGAGPLAVLARPLCGDAIGRTAADIAGFRFEQIKSADHELMLPGGLRFGGLLNLSAAASPHPIFLANTEGAGPDQQLRAAYSRRSTLELRSGNATASELVDWVLRK